MELREGVRALGLECMSIGNPVRFEKTDQVCVPHAHCAFGWDLAHQETVHPSECELHELDSLFLEVRGQRSWWSIIALDMC